MHNLRTSWTEQKKSSNSILACKNRRKRKRFFQILSHFLINFSLTRFCATNLLFRKVSFCYFARFCHQTLCFYINCCLRISFMFCANFLHSFYQDMRWITVKWNVFNEKSIGFWTVNVPAGSFDWKSQKYAFVSFSLHEYYNLIHQRTLNIV